MTADEFAIPETPVPGCGRGLFVEFASRSGMTGTDEACPLTFGGDPTPVLFFISWAYSIRLGGMHELAQAALHMQRKHKVDLRPLLTYADRDVEDEDDRHALEHAWQDAAPLAAACRAVATALAADDPPLRALVEGHDPPLAARLLDLAAMCDWATARTAQVRLSFLLD